MKKLLFLIVLPLLLMTNTALGEPDLVGIWSIDMYYIYSDGSYGHETPPYEITIDTQVGNRFSGCVWDGGSTLPERGQYFSGVVDGKNIYITHWDSISIGTVNKKGTHMEVVNQAFDADDRTSKTSIGTGTKLDEPWDPCPVPLPPLP